ncbi:hypothetical protein CLU79DRAFT_773316 [Phycomyces nitens]|nr:hypothetical protein CLU79DRAFT_773316 [Phycomyces nitens]
MCIKINDELFGSIFSVSFTLYNTSSSTMATTLVTSCQTQPSNNKSLFSSPELTSTKLLQPTTQKSVTLHNRIVFPSICTYSAKDGCLTDSQLTHYGALAASGPGLVIIETTAVEAHGRTTVYDSGIWKDEQVESLSRVASLIKSQGSVPGIQLSHSGSKPYEPSIESRVTRTQDSDSSEEESEAFEADNDDRCPQSNRLTITEIRANVQKWADSAILANRAGIEVLEINAANRHLLHYFLSGNLNTRTDFYGGSLQNRMRFPLEVARAVRAAWPEEKPLWFRLPTTDFANAGPMDHDCDGWDVYQAIEFGKELKKIGIDIITVSNGTTMVDSKYPAPYTCQAQVSNVIKHEVGIQTGSTGNTRTCDEAESVLQKHQADYIIIGSECLLRHCVSKKDVPGHTADNVSPSESSMLMSMCTLAI